ncbi:MAG: hypothetical protein SV375_02700, partial [Thermodesulfobacteriota bacterium]|nr:hypothetical protein [Thermodesulfobacteriota bacterium]
MEKQCGLEASHQFLRGLLRIFKVIPFSLLNGIGDLFGVLAYRLVRDRRYIGLSNLRIVFPDKPERHRSIILKKCWQNIGKNMLELVKYNAVSREVIRERVSIIGKENLEQFIGKKKGIIALSAHFGNFPLLTQRLAVEGYPIAVIYRDMHNKFLAPMVPMLQKASGIEPIPDRPRHRCVARSLRWLKKGGILFLQIDQNPSLDSGVTIDFFGKKLPTFRGPIIFATRTDSIIVPMFIIRKHKNHHH